MINQIVLAFTPSKDMKDWQLCADGNHNWYYEPRCRFYCPAHEQMHTAAAQDCSPRHIGKEPWYDSTAGRRVASPRVYIDHYPQKGEWEHFKTIDDVIASPLFRKNKKYKN